MALTLLFRFLQRAPTRVRRMTVLSTSKQSWTKGSDYPRSRRADDWRRWVVADNCRVHAFGHGDLPVIVLAQSLIGSA